MNKNVTHKLIESHLVEGRMQAGEEIGLKIDQTLTQDATGTLVMLELEAMGFAGSRPRFPPSTSITTCFKTDFKNADDHLFLRSACQQVRHLVQPCRATASAIRCTWSASAYPARRCSARTATPAPPARSACWRSAPAGSRSRSRWPASRFTCKMPRIWGVRLTGALPDWVSAKDVILEMLRRHGVDGGIGTDHRVLRPGLRWLCARWTAT